MDSIDVHGLQQLDAAHHLHPFNDNAALAKKGTRILTKGEGAYVWDAEGNKLLGTGQELAEVCRHLEITESTWHRWVAQYGGMKANEAKRLKELEAENARLKKLVANQALDIDMLKEISSGNF